MTPGIIILIVVVVIVAILAVVVVSMYNGLVQSNVKAQEAWSGITVQLKRRADLIPNLVEAVKGYAAHESGVFEKVTEARAAVAGAADNSPAAAAKADGELTSALKSLFAVAENYPDLKASSNFLDLQSQVTNTEDKISASRRFYNSAVNDLNNAVEIFPSSMFAAILGITAYPFFEAEEAARNSINASDYFYKK